MRFALLLMGVLTLQGCASGCTSHCLLGFGPGNSAFEAIADYHDRGDPCQLKGKPEDYKFPSFCGANHNKRVVKVYDPNGRLMYVAR